MAGDAGRGGAAAAAPARRNRGDAIFSIALVIFSAQRCLTRGASCPTSGHQPYNLAAAAHTAAPLEHKSFEGLRCPARGWSRNRAGC